MMAIIEAMMECKASKNQPTLIVAHTLKGWGLKSAAMSGNHSSLPGEEEVEALRSQEKFKTANLFERFSPTSPEGKFLKERGESLYKDIKAQNALKDKNHKIFLDKFNQLTLPNSLDINLKMASYPHTQWMLGQLTAKLTRIANTDEKKKPLPDSEKAWKAPSELFISMAPDVGTSTNLNPAMDGKIFGAIQVDDVETEYGVKDTKLPDLVPGEDVSDRFLRFEIAECNVMSCVGSFGKMRDTLGIPIMPLMTVYDFFIKRAHDQYFYNMYWKSSFFCIGTPSGVTLSPEGAQHGWKSDFQIPNQITWEPFFCQELDWIFVESLRRHYLADNQGRSGVLIRCVTRGVEQKEFAVHLKRQAKFKNIEAGTLLHRTEFAMNGATNEAEVENIDEASMMEQVRLQVLQGAYYLIDYRGYAGFEPGDNVVNIFAMGSLTTEAIKASEALLAHGIYANVIVVTSPDLLCGIQAHENDYHYMKNVLAVTGDLYLHRKDEVSTGEMITVAGKRIPIVSVHDGEAGLLDNLGSIVGVRQESCAVRKHSKCGRPPEIYAYHGIDAESVVEACGKVLADTALEKTIVREQVLNEVKAEHSAQNWTDLWPSKNASHKH